MRRRPTRFQLEYRAFSQVAAAVVEPYNLVFYAHSLPEESR